MSAAEREIRDAVVVKLRELLPGARIIHELNVAGTGSNRMDVAAVGDRAIVGVEIKSQRDTLKRLGEQWRAFSECCDTVIVVAHERHFTVTNGHGTARLNHPDFVDRWGRNVWMFPEPAARFGPGGWALSPWEHKYPRRAASQLKMLWAEELRAECARHRLATSRRSTRSSMIYDLAWLLTGREVVQAVCRQLRCRAFVEADPPVEASPAYSPKSLRKQAAQEPLFGAAHG